MTTVFYNKEEFKLPRSMIEFDGMQLHSINSIDILQENNQNSGYKILICVLIQDDDYRIHIIYGVCYNNYPNDYPKEDFHCITIHKSEMIEFDDHDTRFILDVGLNSCAILLKTQLIVIDTDPEFISHLDMFGEGFDYQDNCLFTNHIQFISEITEFPCNKSNERISLRVENDDISLIIYLLFTYGNHSSNTIRISISNEQIKLEYTITKKTIFTNVSYEYNDYPLYRTDEEIEEIRESRTEKRRI